MEILDLKRLVSIWQKKYNENVTSINDLILKDLDGGNLSCNQFVALKNYYKLRIEYLSDAIDRTMFTEKSFTTKLAANFVSYKEFI